MLKICSSGFTQVAVFLYKLFSFDWKDACLVRCSKIKTQSTQGFLTFFSRVKHLQEQHAPLPQ